MCQHADFLMINYRLIVAGNHTSIFIARVGLDFCLSMDLEWPNCFVCIFWQRSSRRWHFIPVILKKGYLNFPFSHQCSRLEWVCDSKKWVRTFSSFNNIYQTPSAYQILPCDLRSHPCSKKGIILQERRKICLMFFPRPWRKGFSLKRPEWATLSINSHEFFWNGSS